MKQILEFLPLALFVITYQYSGTTLEGFGYSVTLDGIYSATLVLMVSYSLVWLGDLLLSKKNDKRLMWSTIAVVVLGSATVALKSASFIMWKPTIFNWLLAIGIYTPKLFNRRSWLRAAMENGLTLPERIWLRLEHTWAIYFFIVGALNIFVAYSFSEAFWVDYKLYSAIGFTILIMILTMVIIYPTLKQNERGE